MMTILQNMETDILNLTNIGLSEKEAIIYLTLSNIGKSSAYKLAKKSKIKMPTVYLILESLIQKNLVLQIPDANRKIFISNDLTGYLNKINSSLVYSQNLNQKLKTENTNKNPSTKYFDGVTGILESINYKIDEFKTGEEFLQIYGPLDNLAKKELMNSYVKWNNKIRSKKIKQKVLVSEKDFGKFTEMENMEKIGGEFYQIKKMENVFLPENISLEVNSKFVRIISAKPAEATIIEDKKLILILQQLFENLWNNNITKI
jgi:sugar-specific transcriptional regulator TrmB